MRKLFGKLFVMAIGLLLVILIGCSAVQDGVTPAYIAPEAIEYADAPATSFLPFTTLWDLKRIDKKVEYKHKLTQLDYARLSEDDTNEYVYIKDGLEINMASAQELQNNLFNPQGPLGMLIPTLLGGTLGAVLISKPSDKKEIEILKNGGSK